jgi:hypothetical protein
MMITVGGGKEGPVVAQMAGAMSDSAMLYWGRAGTGSGIGDSRLKVEYENSNRHCYYDFWQLGIISFGTTNHQISCDQKRYLVGSSRHSSQTNWGR